VSWWRKDKILPEIDTEKPDNQKILVDPFFMKSKNDHQEYGLIPGRVKMSLILSLKY